jgi:hypothetical protein
MQTNAYQDSHVHALIFNSYYNAVIFLWSIARSGDSIGKMAEMPVGQCFWIDKYNGQCQFEID